MSNSKEIWEAIEKLPICDDGKKGVKALVKALGHEVKEDYRLPKEGEIWMHGVDVPCIMVDMIGELKGVLLSTIGSPKCLLDSCSLEKIGKEYTYAAKTVEAYYKEKYNG